MGQTNRAAAAAVLTETETRSHASKASHPLFLNCPRCGLSIRPRATWLVIEHCPRCVARARTAVKLFSSPLPADTLYAEGSAPSLEQRGAATISRRSLR